jgi:predicted alpha/beta hydrolase family esterase
MKLPYAAVEFTKDGHVADPSQVTAALAMLDRVRATDVLVLAHGWNNDMGAAERLYTRLSDNLAGLIPSGSTARPAVIGILWPSVRWADEDQIAGGGVSMGDDLTTLTSAIAESVDDPDLAARLTELAGNLDTAEGRAAFLSATRDLLPAPVASGAADEDPAPASLRTGEAEGVFDAVRVAVSDTGDDLPDMGTPGGGAPGVAPDLLGDATSGAGLFGQSWSSLGRQLLNTATYYTMKARASDVGANGLAPLVDQINAVVPERRIHLAGHSFGARVVSAAATNISTPIESLTLLQGAFSHYGFTANYAGSGKDGAFRGALTNGRIHGPVVITHTRNDQSVRVAYATASRLAGQAGASFGDRNDLYGGIGANGSQGTNAAELVLGDAASDYAFQAATVYNLNADHTISGHSDVTNPAVANALGHSMGLL